MQISTIHHTVGFCYRKRGPPEKTNPVSSFTGLLQESYVNPLYLGRAVVNSISNISFEGAWV